MFKIGILLGVGFCGLSVVIGAFVAHALKGKISDYGVLIFDKALFYQVFHALAILFISILEYNISELSLNVCVILFSFGIILFSGSLYILAVTNMKWLGMITPIGGVMFILGWSLLFIKVLKLNQL